jgi:hypothetical protein
MAYRRVRNYGNTIDATSGAETANSSRAPRKNLIGIKFHQSKSKDRHHNGQRKMDKQRLTKE